MKKDISSVRAGDPVEVVCMGKRTRRIVARYAASMPWNGKTGRIVTVGTGKAPRNALVDTGHGAVVVPRGNLQVAP